MSMVRTLFILAILCVCTFAMVPNHRFARETDKKVLTICAPQTPCSWGIYEGSIKAVYMTVVNSYCTCGPDQLCILDEDDSAASAFVYKCKAKNT